MWLPNRTRGEKVAIELTCPNVPAAALPLLISQMESYGARCTVDSDGSGTLEHSSGSLCFEHRGNALVVWVTKNSGHFPDRLIVGGIRQAIEEAVELVSGGKAWLRPA